MFADMKSLPWKKKLENLEIGGVEPVENEQTVYSAIRDNAELFKGKKFAIRTNPVSLEKTVTRIQ